MPTKTTTQTNSSSQNQYNQGSMNTFNNFTAGGSGVLNQDIQDPQSQIGFNQRIQQGNSNLFNMFNSRNSAVANRASAFGGNTPLFLQNQLNRNSNSLAGNQANMFNQNMLYADQLRQGAASQMLNYRPLQTGVNSQSTQTQSQGGLGAWATPLISAGMGIATGGMSMMGGGGGFFSGAGASPTNPGFTPSFNPAPDLGSGLASGANGASMNPWLQ